jgi:hypothetical protein
MKPKLCLLLTIACLLLLLGLFRLGLEGGQEAVASTLRESGMTRSAWAHNYKLTNAPALTATYVFNLDGTPVNDTVSARFFGLNLIWPFMQFDAGSRQVLDPEVKATLTELGPANF